MIDDYLLLSAELDYEKERNSYQEKLYSEQIRFNQNALHQAETKIINLDEANGELYQDNESLRDELEAGLINKNNQQKRINNLLNQGQTFQTRYQNSTQQINQLADQISQLESQLNKLSSRPTWQKYQDLKRNYKQTITDLQVQQEQLKQIKEQISQIQVTKQNQQVTIDNLKEQLNNKGETITQLSDQLQNASDNLSKAGKTGKH